MAYPHPTKTWHTDTYASIDPSRPELSLAGKVVAITGGGSGIGGAIARSCAKAGATVALIGRRETILKNNEAKIAAMTPGARVLLLQADIASEDEIFQAFKTIKEELGPVDVFVNNAAYFNGASSVIDEPIDSWFKSHEVNVKGNLLAARAFVSVASPGARVADITSGVAHLSAGSFPGYSAYASSKMASTIVFDYLLSERSDLHVVHVHPGEIVTEMAEKVGMIKTIDTAELPGDFTVWAVSDEAKFLEGRIVWSNWDVDELKAMKKEILAKNLFTVGIKGWPFDGTA